MSLVATKAGAVGAKRPLSSMEKGIWLMEKADARVDYAIRTRMEITGALDPGRLGRALSMVVARHGALRGTYVEQQGDVCCIERTHVGCPLRVVDMEGLDEPGHEAALHGVLADMGALRVDLSSDHLLQAVAIRHADRRWTLWITVHHIAFDEGSNAVLLRELLASYAGYPVDDEPGRYADYLAWLSALPGDEAHSFWQRQLASATLAEFAPVSEPLRREGVEGNDEPSASLRGAEASRLLERCAAWRCTPFVFLLGIMQVWLSRYTGSSAGVIAVPTSARPDSDAPLIGLCLNTLAIPFRIDEAQLFDGFLASLKKQVADILEYRTFPFAEAVASIESAHGDGNHPLLRYVFSYRTESEGYGTELAGLCIESAPVRFPDHGIDISLVATRTPDGFALALGGSSRLLGVAGRATLLAHVVGLVRQALGDGVKRVGDLRLDASSLPARPASLPRAEATCTARFRTCAQAFASNPAVYDEHGVISFAELSLRVETMAAGFHVMGVRGGDLVALCVAANAWRVACQFALLRLGAGFVPVREDFPIALRERIARSSRLFVVNDGASTGTFACHTIDAIREAGRGLPAPEAVAHELAPALVIHTSGSTGESRPVWLTHRALDLVMAWAIGYFSPPPDTVIAAGTSPAFDMSILETMLPFVAGFSCLMLADPLSLLDSPHRDRVTWLNGVPSVLREITRDPRRLGHVDHFTVGGEAVPPEWVATLRQTYDHPRIDNLYGPSEVTLCALAQRLDTPQLHATPPVGPELPTHQVRIVDTGLRELPAYAIGQFVFSGPCIGLGYQDAPAATAAVFVPDPFSDVPGSRMQLSGDLGYRSDDGIFHILGRRDAQTKLRGMRLDLSGIDTILRESSGVSDAASAIVAEGSAQAWLGAILVADEGLVVDDVRVAAMARLPAWQVPRRLVRAGAIPRTSSGKVDRCAISALLAQADRARTRETPAVSPDQARVLAAWRDILGAPIDDIDMNFFDAGGTSLLVPRLHAVLAGLGHGMRLGDIFKYGTVRQQASQIFGERRAVPAETEDDEWRSA